MPTPTSLTPPDPAPSSPALSGPVLFAGTQFGSFAFWQGLALRLAPLLGDIETKLGDPWMDLFEACFSHADFETFACARERRASAPYVLTLLAAAAPLTESIDDIQAAHTEAGGVALLLEACKEKALWPTTIDADANGIAFWRDGEPFATVHRVAASPALSPTMRRRAQSLLGGLRKHGNVEGEFHRRLTRWPGLASLQAGQRAGPRGTHAHWPCPAEWLIGARRLWRIAGELDPSTAQTQALAAAVFGVDNWHQLCAALPKGASDADWWALLGPFRVYAYDTHDDTSAVHADPLAAFVDFAARAQQVCAGSTAFSCSISTSLHSRMPYLTVSAAELPDEPTPTFLQREAVLPRVYLTPLMQERATDESVALVQPALQARDWRALLACFRLEPEDDVWPNRIFHVVRLGDIQCEGTVTGDGPSVSVGDCAVPIGVCALRKFVPGDADWEGPIPAGWWLVKYEAERRVDLTTLSDRQARELSSAFGLPLLGQPSVTLPEAQPVLNRAKATRAFYASPSWISLRQWCRAHPGIARSLEATESYLEDWHRRALLD